MSCPALGHCCSFSRATSATAPLGQLCQGSACPPPPHVARVSGTGRGQEELPERGQESLSWHTAWQTMFPCPHIMSWPWAASLCGYKSNRTLLPFPIGQPGWGAAHSTGPAASSRARLVVPCLERLRVGVLKRGRGHRVRLCLRCLPVATRWCRSPGLGQLGRAGCCGGAPRTALALQRGARRPVLPAVRFPLPAGCGAGSGHAWGHGMWGWHS